MKPILKLLPILLTLPLFPVPTLSLVAGGGPNPGDGPADKVTLHEPFACAPGLDGAGQPVLYTLEFDGRVGRVDGKGRFTTLLCGTNDPGLVPSGEPGRGPLPCLLAIPHHLLLTDPRTLLLSDTGHHRVLRLDLVTMATQSVAGSGAKGFGGDGGPATAGMLNGVHTVDRNPTTGDLVICDLGNRRVRKVTSAGILSTVAGNGSRGVPTNGNAAAESPLVDPRAAAVDSEGRVYILERGGNALRMVDLRGRIATVAGTNVKGVKPQGGAALEVPLNGPKHLWCDGTKAVYLCDTENNLVFRFDRTTSTLTRVAGTGKRGNALTSDPLSTELARPHGVTGDGKGNLYICDSYNGRILKIEGI